MSKVPPIGVIRAILVKSKDVNSLVVSPYIEPEKNKIPSNSSTHTVFFVFSLKAKTGISNNNQA
jgi:hypothetical protein